MSAQLIFDIEKLEKERDALRRQLAEVQEKRSQASASSKAAALEAIAAWKAMHLKCEPGESKTVEGFMALLARDEAQLAEAIATVIEKQLAARDEALEPFALAFDAAEEAKRRGGSATLTGATNLTFDIEFGGEVLHRVTVHDFRNARAVLKGAA